MPAAGKGVAPTCVVWALKDPASANLDRVQVIKCWGQGGQSFEKVDDVAWAGDRKPDKWSGEVPAWRDAFGRRRHVFTIFGWQAMTAPLEVVTLTV